MNTTSQPDLLQILINIADAFPSIYLLIKVICVLIGLILFGTALLDLYSLNNDNAPRRAGKSITGSGIGWKIFTALILVSSTYFLDVTQNTLYGGDATGGSLIYQTAGLSQFQQFALEAIFGLFHLVGLIAFCRGWYLMQHHFNGGNGGVGAPIAHMFGGTMLAYLDVWLPAIGRWTGFDFVQIFLF